MQDKREGNGLNYAKVITTPLMTFGSTLAQLRRSRGWSQESLALRAGLSQRHISFLETGRAEPGKNSLAKLAEALALQAWEQRALMETVAPSVNDQSTLEPDAAVVTALIERFSPWPAYAYHPDGSLAGTNAPLRSLFRHAATDRDLWRVTAPETGPNIYDLVLHPSGLVNWMENATEVASETLRRVRIEAAQNLSLLPLLRRLEAYPSAKLRPPHASLPPPILIERYSIPAGTFSIISVISFLASPGDQSLGSLRIESFVPADADSEALLMRL
jgi:transcriptional regulator with XRE-family HTH domain